MATPDMNQNEQMGAPAGQPPTENASALERVVRAGMTLMYDKNVFAQMFPQIEQAVKSGAPLAPLLASQALGLIKILNEKAQNMPKNVMAPAATALLIEFGDFLVKSGVAEPTAEDMQKAVQILIPQVVKMFGGQPGQPPQQAQQPPQGGMIQNAMGV